MDEKSREKKIALTLGFTLEGYRHLTLLGKQNQTRQRVQELWCNANKAQTVQVWYWWDNLAQVRLMKVSTIEYVKAPVPEAEAWEEALLWLADHPTQQRGKK